MRVLHYIGYNKFRKYNYTEVEYCALAILFLFSSNWLFILPLCSLNSIQKNKTPKMDNEIASAFWIELVEVEEVSGGQEGSLENRAQDWESPTW